MWNIDINKLIDTLSFNSEQPITFNSGFFIFFFLFVMIGYNFFKNKPSRSLYLMVASFYFYYKSSGIFLLVLIFTIFSNFWIAQQLGRSQNNKHRKYWLTLSILLDVGILCYFKYTNFFLGSVSSLIGKEFVPFDIFLPIGISFFMFQSMSYIIDVYHRKLAALDNCIDYAFYVSFFPQLVAGPIVRAKDFIPQIYKPTIITPDMLGKGIFLIISGLFKKMVISDYISVNFVDRIFDNPSLYTGFETLMGVYGYALQIYCDFSGYSDIAIGLALLMGFRFNINFDSPYQATSISDFWRRWHISLSGWLKDYLYIPLGGNRKGKIRTYVNLFITMLIGGLWHGASWTFVIWGGFHGALLAVDKIRKKYLLIESDKVLVNKMLKIGSIFVTFNLVCIGWVFFRADSLQTAGEVFSRIIHGIDFSILPQFIDAYPMVILLILVGYILHMLPQRYEDMAYVHFTRIPLAGKAVLMALFIFLLVQVRSSEILPFIYFQF